MLLVLYKKNRLYSGKGVFYKRCYQRQLSHAHYTEAAGYILKTIAPGLDWILQSRGADAKLISLEYWQEKTSHFYFLNVCNKMYLLWIITFGAIAFLGLDFYPRVYTQNVNLDILA